MPWRASRRRAAARPTFLSSSFFCPTAILRGKFGGINSFAIRTAALPTGRADLQGDGGRFPDSVA
jgi:hypothetical protein